MEFSNLSLVFLDCSKNEFKKVDTSLQFEPERSKERQGEIYRDNGDEESESDTMGQDRRISSDPWGWCKCGKCCKTPSKKECLCCKEVESVQYFDLHGKYIFANEKKIYNEIKYVTEIKYINFIN